MIIMVDWSDDKIAALSKQDLKNLLANAERKSAAEIVARCKAEMDKRDTSKPRKASKPRTELKEFEHAMSEQLAEIGKAMAAKYDLSEETAKARSVGVKGFKAHKLLDSTGYAKLGGMQRDGSVAVDRIRLVPQRPLPFRGLLEQVMPGYRGVVRRVEAAVVDRAANFLVRIAN